MALWLIFLTILDLSLFLSRYRPPLRWIRDKTEQTYGKAAEPCCVGLADSKR